MCKNLNNCEKEIQEERNFSVDFRALIEIPQGYQDARVLKIGRTNAELITSRFEVSENDQLKVIIKAPTKVASFMVDSEVEWLNRLGDSIHLKIVFKNISSNDLQLLKEIIGDMIEKDGIEN